MRFENKKGSYCTLQVDGHDPIEAIELFKKVRNKNPKRPNVITIDGNSKKKFAYNEGIKRIKERLSRKETVSYELTQIFTNYFQNRETKLFVIDVTFRIKDMNLVGWTKFS